MTLAVSGISRNAVTPQHDREPHVKKLDIAAQRELVGGDWGFYCGLGVGAGIALAVLVPAAGAGAGMLVAEWMCTADYVLHK